MESILLLALAAPLLQEDPTLLTQPLPRPPQTVEFDDPYGSVPGTFVPAPALQQVEDPLALVRTRRAAPKPAVGGPTPTFESPLSIRELLTEPVYFVDMDGALWARGRDYRARFAPEGFGFFPVFGPTAPREFPVEFALRSVTVGGEAIPLDARGVTRSAHAVTLDHGALHEVHHVGLDQVEQTFVFDALPGSGELVVDLAVASELQVVENAAGVHFVHPTLGHVTYGNAFVLDAAGARAPIARTWTGDGLRLTVPADFLAGAVLPVTIDPPVTSFASTFGSPDDQHPDITYAGRGNRYWVCWEEYTSATNSDCYITSFSFNGVQGGSFAVEIGANHWTRPRLAYHYGADRLLVVGSVEVGGPGGSGRILGQLVDPAAGSLIGSNFIISSIGFRKLWPDVGGNNWDSLTNSYFCVVWSFESSATNRNPQYRIVDWDGSLVTGITTVDSSADDDIHTTISDTHGDGDLLGDWWTMAWVRDTNGDERGQVWARRVVWSGSTGLGAGNFLVEGAANCAFPSVSSRLDDNLVADSDRPSIVAYDRDFATVSGTPPRQRSIYARVVTDGMAFGANAVSLTLEDVDTELDQFEACVATDGNAFYLTYSEEYWNAVGSGDHDMYMLSGHLSQTSSNAYLALAERHQNMSFTSAPESQGRCCTIWDGESSSTSDDGAAIWTASPAGNGGTLRGYTLEVPTFDTSTRIAIGRQFCDANPNASSSSFSEDVSSWMWMDGDQTLGTVHRAYCVDVTPNAAGYLIASTVSTNINMPGNTIGRLCLAGSGRYVDQVQNSGSAGTYTTNINPLNIPQPTGFVSASAGETWYFQHWHRDILAGMPTSNFSNACSLQFVP